MTDETPASLVLGRELDLHTFVPRDIPSVVDEYLLEARRLGYHQVRLIHGRGIGYQREVVRKILAATAFVQAFDDDVNGNRGATLVSLKP